MIKEAAENLIMYQCGMWYGIVAASICVIAFDMLESVIVYQLFVGGSHFSNLIVTFNEIEVIMANIEWR